MPQYQPVATDSHGLEEELQWARLLASGDPARGMALVTIQKLCTAFHEFAPAWEHGALSPSSLDYFKARLIARTVRVLDTLRTNELGKIRGYGEVGDGSLRLLPGIIGIVTAVFRAVHAVPPGAKK